MATGASIASLGIGAVQTGFGIASSIKNKKAIENFNRQELTNPYENVQISTKKSEQQTDANLASMATSVDALQRSGSRAVLGGIPILNDSHINLQNLISQDLENQEMQKQLLIAQGEEKIQNIQESREQGALLGLGQSLQTANQNIMSGVGNILSSTIAIGQASDLKNGESTIPNPFTNSEYQKLTGNYNK